MAETRRTNLLAFADDHDLLRGWDAEEVNATPTWSLTEELVDELIHRIATTMGTSITVLDGCLCNEGDHCPW